MKNVFGLFWQGFSYICMIAANCSLTGGGGVDGAIHRTGPFAGSLKATTASEKSSSSSLMKGRFMKTKRLIISAILGVAFRRTRRMKHILLTWHFLFFLVLAGYSQAPIPPPVKNGFLKLTSHAELSAYVSATGAASDLISLEVIGRSVQGRELYAIGFSSGKFGKDASKIRVLIFAQQHGNEQSGKEGALLLTAELLKPERRHLFDRIDLALIPQVNPDGAEVNRRRNANGLDLNRNHVILTEPETRSLHGFFDRYLFEVTMDVHEYSPYGEEWARYGYRKNSEVTVGSLTNINIPDDIRNLSDSGYLPFTMKYLRDRGYSSFTYCPGGPPDTAYIRHSTFDVNDGRQSFGIENTFSFIQEGMNGKDDSVANLRRRAEGQMTGMLALLEYVFGNKERIQHLVAAEREKLISPADGQMISIQSEHVPDGSVLVMPLLSLSTGNDTVVHVEDYRPMVRSLYDVKKPAGYLVPADCTLLLNWVSGHGFRQKILKAVTGLRIEQYGILSVDSIDFEGDRVVNPVIETKEVEKLPEGRDFIYIPVNQLKGNLLVLALEPKSMLGLATYRQFARLLKPGTSWPVLKVNKP